MSPIPADIYILNLGSFSTHYFLEKLALYHPNTHFEVYNTPFESINKLLPVPNKALVNILNDLLLSLKKSHLRYLIVPNITLHYTLDKINIKPLFNLELIHPIQLGVNMLLSKNIKKVILFGSLYTMESHYILDYLNPHNITVEIPIKSDRLIIDKFRQRVYSKEETSFEVRKFKDLYAHYHNKQNPVLIACTELSIYAPSKAIDLLDILAKSATHKINI